MAQNSKTGLVISIIFCVIFAATTTTFFILHKQEHQLRIKVENELAELQSKKQEIEKELDEIVQDREQLRGELADYREKAEELAEDIALEKEQRQRIEDVLESKEERLESLRTELDSAKSSVSDLKQMYESLKSENEELSSSLSQLRLAKKALEAKIGTAGSPEGVELGTVIVKPGQTEEDIEKPQGRVLVINREFDFIMVDLGRVNGIKPGSKLGVYHANKLIAEAEVEKVYEDMCSAVILNGKEVEISEDDRVRLL